MLLQCASSHTILQGTPRQTPAHQQAQPLHGSLHTNTLVLSPDAILLVRMFVLRLGQEREKTADPIRPSHAQNKRMSRTEALQALMQRQLSGDTHSQRSHTACSMQGSSINMAIDTQIIRISCKRLTVMVLLCCAESVSWVHLPAHGADAALSGRGRSVAKTSQ